MSKLKNEMPNSEKLIVAKGVYKKFCSNMRRSMAYGLLDVGKVMLGASRNSGVLRKSEFWALEDISFDLRRGEILGILGANGAGKSTLLRVLNGIYPPDKGRIEIRGGIGGLIALGAGFHPYLSGRENIFLNGTILGMRNFEIKKNLDSILEFADIGTFVDSPVSTYSSGMYARLAFSIAIHCVPDILLIDEVLSVGDFSFQNKCLRKISELRNSAKGAIFVGHNMDMVESLCDRAILLSDHKIIADGNPLQVIAKYRELSREKELAYEISDIKSKFKSSQSNAQISTEKIIFRGSGILANISSDSNSALQTNRISYGDDLRIFIDLETKGAVERPQIGLGISHSAIYPWNVVYDSNISNLKLSVAPLKAGRRYRLMAEMKKPNLVPGVYRINFMIRDGNSFEVLHQQDGHKNTEFTITEIDSFIMNGERPSYNSLIQLETNWQLSEL